MKVTVAGFPDGAPAIEETWGRLSAHLASVGGEVLVLPELVASPAFWTTRVFDEQAWRAAVAAHEEMSRHLARLTVGLVLGTRAVERAGRRLNETFSWTHEGGFQAGRAKAWLPEEDGGWEATWFDRGEPPTDVTCHAGFKHAFLVCTELLVGPGARGLGKAGAHLIAVPRATGGHDRWMVGTRMAAIASGAFVATANRRGADERLFAGGCWIVGPDGDLLCMTGPHEPFATADIDLAEAEAAKLTYPRYVAD